MSDTPKTLYAFYDRGIAPTSFDIIVFLIEAERLRRTKGYNDIHVVLTPREDGARRMDVNLYDEGYETWRLNQILVPCCRLLPSVSGVTVCASRAEAEAIRTDLTEDVFPPGYTVAAPTARHHHAWTVIAAHEGHDLQFLRASDQARAYAKQWIAAKAGGRKVVALTLREAQFTPKRNSDVAEWLSFARKLDEAGYFPVVLRDTDVALEEPSGAFAGITMFPEAAFNIDLRLAFYEECHVAAFVCNGPASICFYDRNVRYLYFVTGEWLTDNPPVYLRVGIAPGTTPPFANRFQRWIWAEQDCARLMAEFTALDRDLEASRNDGTYEQGLEPQETNRRPLSDVGDWVARWAASQGDPSTEWEILAYCKEQVPAWAAEDLYVLRACAKYYFKCGDFARAFAVMHGVIDKSPDEKTYLDLGLMYEARGQHEEARALYGDGCAKNPGSPLLAYKLALAQKACGDLVSAAAHLRRLIDGGVIAGRLFLELGHVYESMGEQERALETYNAAVARGIVDQDIMARKLAVSLIARPESPIPR